MFNMHKIVLNKNHSKSISSTCNCIYVFSKVIITVVYEYNMTCQVLNYKQNFYNIYAYNIF